MKQIFAIVGETGAGKDSIVRGLKNNLSLISQDGTIEPIKEVVSYATRPIRSNETNGVEHLFISDEEMDRVLKEEALLAYTQIGEYRYCATKEAIKDSILYIINPDGIKALKEHENEFEIYFIYITIPLEEKIERLMKRGDDLEAALSRIESEQSDFDEFSKNQSYDLKIVNIDLEDSIKKAEEYILEHYRSETNQIKSIH